MEELSFLNEYFGEVVGSLLGMFGVSLFHLRHKILEKIKTLSETKEDLKNHDLFSTIDREQTSGIRRIRFDNHKNKEYMLKDFLTIKLNEIEIQTKAFIKRDDIYKMSSDELLAESTKMFNNIVDSHNKKWDENFKRGGIENQESIDYIINVFNDFHNDTVEAINKRLIFIFKSDNYKSNYQKICVMFEVFTFSIDLVFNEGVKSFESMNGHFDNVDYTPMKNR